MHGIKLLEFWNVPL